MSMSEEPIRKVAARISEVEHEIREIAKQREKLSDEATKGFLQSKELLLHRQLEKLYDVQIILLRAPGVGGISSPLKKSWVATCMLRALRRLPTVPGPGSVLSLPPGVHFLLEARYRSLYVRDCYPRLFEAVMGSYASRRIITGTPGIGKSWFFYYFLARLLTSPSPPPAIVWEHTSKPDVTWCYITATDEVRTGRRSDFDTVLSDTATWYIADGVPPELDALANTLLITSPKWETMKALRKQPSQVLYMPFWSLEELLSCRSALYNRVPAELVEKLVGYFGGVPRYVLKYPFECPTAGMEGMLQPLWDALEGCNCAQVQAAIGRIDLGPEATHRMLHIVADANFGKQYMAFASQWVADEFAKKALQAELQGLVSLLYSTSGSLRGVLYEAIMHAVLAQGACFAVTPVSQDLERGSEEELCIGHSRETRFFKDFKGVDWSSAKLTYYRPTAANFPTVDSLRPSEDTLDFFQMIVGSSKEVDSADLSAILSEARLLPDVTPRLFYVVPPESYDTFTLKPGKRWPPGQRNVARNMKLYIMKGTYGRLQVRAMSSGAGRPVASLGRRL